MTASIELSNDELHYMRSLINARIKDTKIRLSLYSRARHLHNRQADEYELGMLEGLQKKLGNDLRHTQEKQMCP